MSEDAESGVSFRWASRPCERLCDAGDQPPVSAKNTFLSATNPMTYTHPNKQKLRGLHLAASLGAKARSGTSSKRECDGKFVLQAIGSPRMIQQSYSVGLVLFSIVVATLGA